MTFTRACPVPVWQSPFSTFLDPVVFIGSAVEFEIVVDNFVYELVYCLLKSIKLIRNDS